MVKKDYHINVVKAEDIKNQNNLENTQNVITQVTNVNEPKELKTGLMIGGLISFFLSMCFMAVTVYFLLQTYSSNSDAQKAVTFIVFILSIGWISYIPGVVCSIISLCLHPFVIKSSSKGQKKAVGIIFTILTIIIIIAYLFIAIYIMSLPSN